MSKPTEQQIISQKQFQNMKQELQSIASKIGELELEKDEHQLVIDSISPMEEHRKCFRLIGGVLVERTVKDVLPAVQQNVQGIIAIMKQLAETYKLKEEEMNKFQKQYDIRIK